MPRRDELPDPLRERVFSVASGHEHGLTRGRMRSTDLSRPFHAVRAPTPPTTTLDLARAYACRMSRHAFFSHVTAARLWDLPLPSPLEKPDRPLDVSAPTGSVVPSGRGIRGHHMLIDDADVVEFAGLRVTSPARTWCDLAGLLNLHDLIAAGDSVLWWRRPRSSRTSRAQLCATAERHRGRRWREKRLAAERRLTDRSDSRAESLIRCSVIDAGLPEPDVNIELYDRRGNFLAMTDLSWRRYMVSADYEGDIHRTDAKQWAKDLARVPRLENAGWLHLRAGRTDLRDPHHFIRHLTLRLQRRGWSAPG